MEYLKEDGSLDVERINRQPNAIRLSEINSP